MTVAAITGPSAIAWEPEPRQYVAFGCPHDEVFYGGVKGGMKSETLIMRPASMLALAQRKFERSGKLQRCMMVIFRRTMQMESRDMIKRTHELYPLLDPIMGFKGWKEQKKTWEFTSGASVTFSYMDGPADWTSWNGVEIPGVGVDEAPNCLPYEGFKFLSAQNRHGDPDYMAARWMLLTGNPGGTHADWIYEYFIGEKNPPREKVVKWDVPVKDGAMVITRSKCFILSKLSDNKYLYESGEYEAGLRSLTAEQQRWFIDGDWGGSSSGHFGGVLELPVNCIDSFEIPASWELSYAVQYAEDEATIIVGAKDPRTERVYAIDEIVTPGATGSLVGSALLSRFKDNKWGDKKRKHDDVLGVINPEAAQNGSRQSYFLNVADALNMMGFRVFPGSQDRVAGWRQMRERLAARKSKQALFTVFRDRCPVLTKQLARAQSDPKDRSDVDDGKGEWVQNRSLNAARLLCQHWPYYERAEEKSADDKIEEWIERMSRKRTRPDDTDGFSTGYGD